MKVSIALATYNGEKFIREQLDSILSQSIQDFELIACDDCSTDSTLQILNEYVEKDIRIKVFANEKNLGFKKNFEKAILLCSGDYIALSDQDDIWTEKHLQVLLENIGKNDLVGANAFLCDEKAKSTGIDLLSCSRIDFLPKTKDEWFFFLLHSNIFQGSACLFRKSLIQKALPIPENVKFHDYWLALVAAAGNGVCYKNDCILYYRQHETNVTENKKQNFFEKIKKAVKGKNQHFIKEQIEILSTLQKEHFDSNCLKTINEALEFYKSLGSTKRFKFLFWYWKNFYKLNSCSSKKLKIICFIKNIILGI
ncbi:glycosyltransferase family 2 protein [Treponema sp.]|uniref:glycosyltransferase family 2 protein n=1 Tax=Treponema sp. TaxID=166 RepID=UPI003F03FC9B